MNIDAYLELVSNVTCNQFVLDEYYKPNINLTQIVKCRILKLLGHNIRKSDYKFFWTTAILTSGLLKKYEYVGCEMSKAAVVSFYEKRFKDKNHTKDPTCVDVAMHGYSLLHLYASNNMVQYSQPINELAEFLLQKHIKTSRGVLPYRSRIPELVFIDSIGMVCPFLAYYGKLFDSKDATNLAVLQVLDFFEYGFDSNTGLPYHAYDSVTFEKDGLAGWGRGVGWFVYGISDSLEYIPKSHPHYENIVLKFCELIDTLLNYQDNFGYLKWHVNDSDSHVDTSATSMFGYALARGVLIGVLSDRYLENAMDCLKALEKSTNAGGSVLDCSGECIGLGRYSNDYGSYPWAQGPTVGLAAMLNSKYLDIN